MTIYRLGDQTPVINATVYVASEATIIGSVALGENCSVWPGAVIRADNDRISVGSRTNIQEGAVLHVDAGFPIQIGENVTIGHQAMLHGCSVGGGTLIGIQAVVLNGAKIGNNCLVGAGAVVTEGKVFEDGSLILGSPAKTVRALDDAAKQRLLKVAEGYVRRAQRYSEDIHAVDRLPTKC